jgi:hypothetical protein
MDGATYVERATAFEALALEQSAESVVGRDMEPKPFNPQAPSPLPELEAQITELAGHLNAANHRLLTLIAEFDRRQGWVPSGSQSCAHWLRWKCGMDLGAAREKVRAALALEKLPLVSAAMASGQLSYSKVRAITRVAAPETEEILLNVALHGNTDHVETTVRCFRRAQQAEELSREARQQAARRLSYLYDDDGSLVFKGSLPAEAGALFIKAIEAALEAEDRSEVSAETRRGSDSVANAAGEPGERPAVSEGPETSERPPITVRRADALVRIAESFLAHGAEELSAGDRNQVVVHVDAQTLREGCAGRCEHEDGPAMAVETARRFSCDASVVSIIEDENGEPLNVGRKTRSIPPALRRALNSRDRGCRFPGCPNKHYVDGHHIKHWVHGGETRLSNLALLCRYHHRQVHEGGIGIDVLPDGALRFILKSGRAVISVAPARLGSNEAPLADDVLHGSWPDLFSSHTAANIVITDDTAVTRWTGESMDYSAAVGSMLYRTRKAKAASPDLHASAETPAVRAHRGG